MLEYKDTETHSEYEMPIVFRGQNCLQGRRSILYFDVHCLPIMLHLVVNGVTETVRKLRIYTYSHLNDTMYCGNKCGFENLWKMTVNLN
jgi:hypothetical protein